MPKAKHPRHGSLQFWPRKRAARIYPRVRNQAVPQEQVLGGFAGYKAGMTHVMAVDNRPNSMMKGDVIAVPVTVIECPPLRVLSIRLYSDSVNGLKLHREIMADFEGKDTKNISRKIILPKKKAAEKIGEGVHKGVSEANALIAVASAFLKLAFQAYLSCPSALTFHYPQQIAAEKTSQARSLQLLFYRRRQQA